MHSTRCNRRRRLLHSPQLCLVLGAALLLFNGVEGRQLRIARYSATATADDAEPGVEVAEVHEVQPTGYPLAGQRPDRAFPLPGEGQGDEAEVFTTTTTTDTPLAGWSTTETAVESTTATDDDNLPTTTLYNIVPAQFGGTENTRATTNGRRGKALSADPAPYPAAGYQPRRPFDLPTEQGQRKGARGGRRFSTTESTIASTTEAGDDNLPTTTLYNIVPAQFSGTEDTRATTNAHPARYPAAGYQPRRPFDLPTEQGQRKGARGGRRFSTTANPVEDTTVEVAATEPTTTVKTAIPRRRPIVAPYPAAGVRPSRAFNLPTEIQSGSESRQHDNSRHPVCGTSSVPVAPKPVDGTPANPLAENVPVSSAPAPEPPLQLQSVAQVVDFRSSGLLLPQPIFLGPDGRAYAAYTTTLPAVW